MRKRFRGYGVIGVFLCMGFSKFIHSYYGLSGQIAVMAGSLLGLLGVVLYFTAMKHYLGAFCITCFSLPLVIGFIGMYLENLYLVFGGIALFFIVGALVIKLVTKHIESKR